MLGQTKKVNCNLRNPENNSKPTHKNIFVRNQKSIFIFINGFFSTFFKVDFVSKCVYLPGRFFFAFSLKTPHNLKMLLTLQQQQYLNKKRIKLSKKCLI